MNILTKALSVVLVLLVYPNSAFCLEADMSALFPESASSESSVFDGGFDPAAIYARSLSEELAFAEQDVKDFYYQLLQGGFFGEQYNNNIVIGDLRLANGIQRSAAILLRLIVFLENKNDQDAYLLLKKINKFFFLKMHRLLAEGDIQRPASLTILSCLTDLYGHKIVTPAGIIAPFRTALTKVLIVLAMVNDGHSQYDSRKETMMLHMNKVKQELLAINNTLGDQRINPKVIKKFTILVGAYQTRKPMIQPTNYKKEMIIIFSLCLIAVIVYWQRDAIKTAAEPVIGWFAWFGSEILKGWKGSLVELGKGLGQGINEAMLEPLPDGTQLNPPEGAVTRGAQLGAAIVRGAAGNAQGIVQPIQAGLQEVLAEAVADGGVVDAALGRYVAPGGPVELAAVRLRWGATPMPGFVRRWFAGDAPADRAAADVGAAPVPPLEDMPAAGRGWWGWRPW